MFDKFSILLIKERFTNT